MDTRDPADEANEAARAVLKGLREYFVRFDRWSPWPYAPNHWKHGIEACDWWLGLLWKSELHQADIDLFIERHRQETIIGSAWAFLGMEFEQWAQRRGFQIAPRPPRTRETRHPEDDMGRSSP